VDPIQSEIVVLGSTPIAAAVVDSLGLRLTAAPSGLDRSQLLESASVAREAPSGPNFLAYRAAHADGSILVVRSGRTDERAARRATDQLDRVGVHVLGAVLNEVAPNVTEESYYFKYIYSYYEDGSRQRHRPKVGTVAAT
jgi:hypothetical protein